MVSKSHTRWHHRTSLCMVPEGLGAEVPVHQVQMHWCWQPREPESNMVIMHAFLVFVLIYRHWNALTPLSALTFVMQNMLGRLTHLLNISSPLTVECGHSFPVMFMYTLSPRCLVSLLDCALQCVAIAIQVWEECKFPCCKRPWFSPYIW